MRTATDLVAWRKLIGFQDHPALACREIAAFRYRVLHVAARITRGARQIHLRIDPTWPWATAIGAAWRRIRARVLLTPAHTIPDDPKAQPRQVEPAPTRHDSRAQPHPSHQKYRITTDLATRSTDQDRPRTIEVRLDYFDFEVDKQSVPLTALRHRRPRSRMPT